MRKILIALLAVVLAACSTAPTAAPVDQAAPAVVEPTQTPVIIVQTVVVESTPVPVEVQPTVEPPTAAPIIVNVVVPTSAPVDTGANTSASPDPNAPIVIDNALGAGWFVNMTRTGNNLSLRCRLYKDITFSVTPTDPNIRFVDFYYRTQDKKSGAIFEWQNAGRMIPDANGNFTIVFSGENVKADFRKPTAWFDYQFIGSSASGVVGRSERIVQQVDYSNDCP